MIVVFYLLALISLAVYSFSQIDLNLTLFQNSIFLSFQHTMIQLGYFNRPLSTAVFVALLLLLFSIFYMLYSRALRGQLGKKDVIILIAGICVIGLISYPAFSYDFFNYLFDARILTHYGLNPYTFKALDFTADPWIRFMHWTHRTYPYGPVWLLVTAVPSFLGFGKFILTAFNFKVLFVLAYLSNCYLISKILAKIAPKQIMFGVVLYALNPLVIIESVVSPHIDSVMATFLLLAVFLLFSKKKLFSLIALLLSGGVKFLTLILLPVWLFIERDEKRLLLISLGLMALSLIPVIAQREFYPWYFLPRLTLAALLPDISWLKILSFGLSVGLLARYVPFIFVGSYPSQELLAENVLLVLPVVFSVFAIVFSRRQKLPVL